MADHWKSVCVLLGSCSVALLCLLIAACHRGTGDVKSKRVYIVPAHIQAEDFQTPLDSTLTRKITTLLEKAGLKEALVLYYREWHDRLSIQINNVTKVRVSATQYPWLYDMVSQAASVLDVSPPITYLVHSAVPKAYVTNVTTPTLVVHSKLIELLNREELLCIVGHELGHVKSGHVLLQDVVSALLYAAEKIPLGDKLAPLSLLLWTREAEISADRVGLLLVQDEGICSRALIKLVLGLPEDAGSINIEEFLRQKAEAEQDAVMLQRLPVLLAEAKANPPFVGTRVQEMADLGRSSQFDELLRRDRKSTIEIELR